MRRGVVRPSLAGMLGVLALAAPAFAKGPGGATIDGDGIDAPIVVEDLGALVGDTGWSAAIFEQVPDPMLDEAPTSDLGPAVTIRWDVPGPDGSGDVIEQRVHPYADGGPLVYTRPGQRLFGSEQARGGWFRAPTRLVGTLQALGVPDRGALEAGAGRSWAPIGASLGAVVLLGAGLALVARRRGDVVPAAT